MPKPEEIHVLVKNIHEKIGHFNEGRTLVEVKKRFFWHDKTKYVRMVVKVETMPMLSACQKFEKH